MSDCQNFFETMISILTPRELTDSSLSHALRSFVDQLQNHIDGTECMFCTQILSGFNNDGSLNSEITSFCHSKPMNDFMIKFSTCSHFKKFKFFGNDLNQFLNEALHLLVCSYCQGRLELGLKFYDKDRNPYCIDPEKELNELKFLMFNCLRKKVGLEPLDKGVYHV